ncbi:MAG: Spy/CpxP family protein refolding chaperone [Chromatiales bacterium]|nr:Spy/CpxP family protein refolding chaperone [Chromatiales bacterium]
MKTRFRYIFVILGAVGIALAVTACGHGFRHHMPADHAVRHIEKLGKQLDLNEVQTAKLSAVTATLRKGGESLRGKHDERQKEVLALIDQPTFDRQRANALVQQTTRDVNDHAAEMIAAIGDFYDSLTPAQQQELRAEVTERMEHADRCRWGH